MKIKELLLAELDREAVGIRKALEHVPEGKNDWKPHEKSMPLGYLATLVANIFAWLDMVLNMDEIDINPVGGPRFRPPEWKTRQELLTQFEASLKKGREVLQNTTDDHLARGEDAAANADDRTRRAGLGRFAARERARADGDVFLIAFAGIRADAHAIEQTRRRARREIAQTKHQISAGCFRLNVLLGVRARSQTRGAGNVVKRFRQAVAHDDVADARHGRVVYSNAIGDHVAELRALVVHGLRDL